MKKLLLSIFALTMAMLGWAVPNGRYQVTNAILHYCNGYYFSGGEVEEITSGDDETAWEAYITVNEDGSCLVSNLIGWQETLTGTYDSSTGKIDLPAQILGDYDYMGVCGGIKGYTTPQALMNYIDGCGSFVTEGILGITLSYDQKANSVSLDTQLLAYILDDTYEGYVGYVYEGYTTLFSNMTLQGAVSAGLTITVNDAEGVRVMADTEDDVIDVEFTDGKAEVEGAQYIRIYNEDPYIITSVKVNGGEVETDPEEAGTFYFIEVIEGTKDIAIEVAKQDVVNMTMLVLVEGLENFETLKVMNKYGEIGRVLATKETIEAENGMANVEFTNLDLPLQVYGTWADGNDYTMEVSVDWVQQQAVNHGTTYAHFMDIYVENDQFLVISLRANETEQKDLYLRGSMNDWGVEEDYKFTQSVNEYGETIFTLTGVEFDAYIEFKLADADWSEYNFGGYDWNSQTIVSANEPIVLYENGSNLRADFYVTKEMVFTFNLATLTLIIEGEPGTSNPPTPDKKDIYLRGQMNGWAAEEAYKFSTEDNITYTLSGVTFGAWTEFKIADAEWGEVNIGAYEDDIVYANQEFRTSYAGANMITNFTVMPEDVIEINLQTNILYINSNTAIQTINSDNLQSKWYNLQGIEVNQAQLLPGNIYINNGKKVWVK